MPLKKMQYTRSTGKRHTYDIEITLNSYQILLNGKLLKDSGPFEGTFDPEPDGGAAYIHARSDIEHLATMPEE